MLEDCQQSYRAPGDKKKCVGTPFLLPGCTPSLGVVLIHSYLAVPEEVKALARYLRSVGSMGLCAQIAGSRHLC